MRNIIDSHLDLAWNALEWKRDLTLPLDELNGREEGLSDVKFRGNATISFPEMRHGRIGLCVATLMARVPYSTNKPIYSACLDYPSHDIAYAAAQGQLAYYRQMEARGEMRICHKVTDLDELWSQWEVGETTDRLPPIGVIIAMEGSDGIVEPQQAEAWYEDGLRCASLVHYGCSAYAAGTGEEGPLTEAGRQLLAEFERLGIILDTTHLSDTSFFEAMDLYTGIVIASHQNSRALVPHQRQFSDEQFRLIIEREGVIGVAFDAWMLGPGYQYGKTSRDAVDIESAADHVDHLCQMAGNVQHVAIGSDLDGGFGTEQCPAGLESIADLQKLDPIFSARGYSDADIDAIFHGNWLRVLRNALSD